MELLRPYMLSGERLRSIRERLGISQREAADRIGVRSQYLSNMENGRIPNPSLETLCRIAKAYGMGVDDLLGYGLTREHQELPEGLRELICDPEWSAHISNEWVETLMRIKHEGKPLETKQEFLEAYLTLRRIFPPT